MILNGLVYGPASKTLHYKRYYPLKNHF